jgi:hypothetical protein
MSGAVQGLIGSLAGVLKDAFWSSVTMLLPGNGTNGAQNNTFTDASTNNFTITRNGNTTQGTFSPFTAAAPYSAATKGGSGYFDGTGDYLEVASAATLTPSGDFTIEFWAYPESFTGNPGNVVEWYAKGYGIQIYTTAGAWGLALSSTNTATYYVLLTFGTGTLNTWQHVAVYRIGNTYYAALNGVVVSSPSSSAPNTGTDPLRIGEFSTITGYAAKGYISNVRYVNGTAVYGASNFTPPTAPLTAITNTSLLLNFTNAGVIDNAMLNALETVGNAQISTAQSKFGGSSMLFDETGDYLTVPVSTNMSLGTGDFTIECWVRFAVTPVGNGQGIYQLSNGYLNSQVRGPGLGAENSTGEWTIYHGTTFTQSTGNVPAINTWYHTAIVRSSGTTKLYVNGTSIISVADTTNYTDQYFVIGGWYSTGFLFNGYIDDLRITKGVARYTATFTPPAAAFPTS